MLMQESRPRGFHLQTLKRFGSAILGYWPLLETAGTAASDLSPNARNAAYTGGTLGAETSPVGKPCPNFETPVGGLNIGASADLRANFNGNEGAFLVTLKKKSLADWSVAGAEYLLRISIDASNQFIVQHPSAVMYMSVQRYIAGVANSAFQLWAYPGDWFRLGVDWSLTSGLIRMFFNGVKPGYLGPAEAAISGSFTGTTQSTGTRLFAQNATSLTWRGLGADAVLLNRPFTNAEALGDSEDAIPSLKTMTFIGDNVITNVTSIRNPPMITSEYKGGGWRRYNHAQAFVTMVGTGVGSLHAQCLEAETDNADLIIISGGQSDDNAAENMTAVQAAFEAAIDSLRRTNPRAAIYCLGLMPQWTDTGGGTEIALNNIREATRAACTAKSVPYFDAYTPHLITAAQTSDGKQPTSAGHTIIKDFVIANLP